MNKKLLINFSLFQAGWFICVLTGDIAAAIFTCIAVALHRLIFQPTICEWRLIAIFSTCGICWDSLLVYFEIIQTPSRIFPLWLACLWILFSTTLLHGFTFLHNRLWLASILAAVLAPLTYLAGTKLTTVSIAEPYHHALLFMACGWSLLFPAGLYAAARSITPAKRHSITKDSL